MNTGQMKLACQKCSSINDNIDNDFHRINNGISLFKLMTKLVFQYDEFCFSNKIFYQNREDNIFCFIFSFLQ